MRGSAKDSQSVRPPDSNLVALMEQRDASSGLDTLRRAISDTAHLGMSRQTTIGELLDQYEGSDKYLIYPEIIQQLAEKTHPDLLLRFTADPNTTEQVIIWAYENADQELDSPSVFGLQNQDKYSSILDQAITHQNVSIETHIQWASNTKKIAIVDYYVQNKAANQFIKRALISNMFARGRFVQLDAQGDSPHFHFSQKLLHMYVKDVDEEDEASFLLYGILCHPECPEDFRSAQIENTGWLHYWSDTFGTAGTKKIAEIALMHTENTDILESLSNRIMQSPADYLEQIRIIVLNPRCPPPLLAILAESESVKYRQWAAMSPACPSNILAKLAKDADTTVRFYVASNINTGSETLLDMWHQDPTITDNIRNHPNLPQHIRTMLNI